MSLKDNWLERQLKTVQELLQEGAEALRENKLVLADSRLKEAAIIIDSAETITPQVLNMRSTVYSELGILSSRTRDINGAISYHQAALEARQKLQEIVEEDIRPGVAASHLNVGSLLAATQQFGDAEPHLTAALDLLADFKDRDSDQIDSLLLGAYQNLGLVYASRQDYPNGLETLKQAAALGHKLVKGGKAHVRPALAQTLMNLAVTQHASGDSAEAITTAEEASEIAIELYESTNDQTILHQYLTTQMNLVTFNEAIDQFDGAEDALFRILELQPGHPEVIKRGKAFYNGILEKTDQELIEGGLPREEAEESLAELEAMG